MTHLTPDGDTGEVRRQGAFHNDPPDLLRVLIDHVQDAIEVLDPATGKFLDANRAAFACLGYTRAELLTLTVFDIDPMVTHEAFAASMHQLRRVGADSIRSIHRRKDGSEFPVENNLSLVQLDREYLISVIRDITETRIEDSRRGLQANVNEALLDLPHAAERMEERVFLQFGQELAEHLTNSRIAFTHFVDDDAGTIDLTAWSHNTLAHYCTAAFDAHYPVASAGVWADAIRKRAPVSFNDYDTCTEKRGLPEGHAPLLRLISVPVISEGKVQMVTGVGNKDSDYTEDDVRTVQFIADAIWSAVHRRRVQLQLKHSEERLRLAVMASGIGVWSWNLESELVEYSVEWLNLLGLQDTPTLDSFELLRRCTHPDDAVGLMATLYAYRAAPEGPLATECRMRHQDGSLRWFLLRAILCDDGDGTPARILGASADITALKKSDEDARIQQAAFNAAANAIVVTGHDGRILLANPAFTALTGYTQEEVVHREFPQLLRSGVQDSGFYTSLWDTVRSGKTWIGELTSRRKDGTHFQEVQTVAPVMNAAGDITHVVFILLDTTERKRLEQQLLENQKMESIGRLAGGIAHDFNNLLAIITGYTEIALESVDANSTLHKDLMHVFQASGRAADITRQLLAYGRRQVIAPKRLNINAVVSACTGNLKQCGQARVSLDLAMADDPWPIFADPAQIEQLLVHLYVNACDAMPDGGHLLISTANCSCAAEDDEETHALGLGDCVQLLVRDNGRGMDEETKARIFEPFYTTKAFGQGRGLGLASVYGIVKQCGGSIHVESAPGSGTTFRILLPRAATSD